MSGFTITTEYVYTLVSALRENNSARYTKLETVGMNQFVVTLFDTARFIVAKNVKYLLSVSPKGPLTTTLESEIVFYQVYINPYTTELIFTLVRDAVPLSYSISKSLLYLFYMDTSFNLNFQCPYTNITLTKQSILSLFAFPSVVQMLYGSVWIHYVYILGAYQPVITGVFNGTAMKVINVFDFNKTFVMLENALPYMYWNTSRFSLANQVPYLSYSATATTSLVVGFNHSYIITANTGLTPDLMSIVDNTSVNIPSSTVEGISYISLGTLVSLTVTGGDVYSKYYFTGVGGIGYEESYAAIQVVNVLNSNNTYVTTSALIVTQGNKTGLTQYITSTGTPTTLWYYYNPTLMTLTVWSSLDPLQPSFPEFLVDNEGTIMISDMIQMTAEQMAAYLDGDSDQRMGCCGEKKDCCKSCSGDGDGDSDHPMGRRQGGTRSGGGIEAFADMMCGGCITKRRRREQQERVAADAAEAIRQQQIIAARNAARAEAEARAAAEAEAARAAAASGNTNTNTNTNTNSSENNLV